MTTTKLIGMANDSREEKAKPTSASLNDLGADSATAGDAVPEINEKFGIPKTRAMACLTSPSSLALPARAPTTEPDEKKEESASNTERCPESTAEVLTPAEEKATEKAVSEFPRESDVAEALQSPTKVAPKTVQAGEKLMPSEPVPLFADINLPGTPLSRRKISEDDDYGLDGSSTRILTGRVEQPPAWLTERREKLGELVTTYESEELSGRRSSTDVDEKETHSEVELEEEIYTEPATALNAQGIGVPPSSSSSHEIENEAGSSMVSVVPEEDGASPENETSPMIAALMPVKNLLEKGSASNKRPDIPASSETNRVKALTMPEHLIPTPSSTPDSTTEHAGSANPATVERMDIQQDIFVEQENLAKSIANQIVSFAGAQKASKKEAKTLLDDDQESEEIRQLTEAMLGAMKKDTNIEDMLHASLRIFEDKEIEGQALNAILRINEIVTESPTNQEPKEALHQVEMEVQETLPADTETVEEVPNGINPEPVELLAYEPFESAIEEQPRAEIPEHVEILEPEDESQALNRSLIPASEFSATPQPLEEAPKQLVAETAKEEEKPTAEEVEKPATESSPFGVETVLVEGKPVQTRIFMDSTGPWYEARPLLLSIKWMTPTIRKHFVRKWVSNENVQLIVQRGPTTNIRSLHLNEKGLQEFLNAIGKEKAQQDEKLGLTEKPNEFSNSESKVALTSSSHSMPDGYGMAELLVGDEVINTPVFKDNSGVWFATYELLTNTKYSHRKDIGKLLRKAVGKDNIRNIPQLTANGSRNKLYANEFGTRKILNKVGKSLDLVALHAPKPITIPSSAPTPIANPQPVAQNSSDKGIYSKSEIDLGGKYVAVRTFTDDTGTWLCAIDIFTGFGLYKRRGTGSLIREFVGNIPIRQIDQNSDTGKRKLSHINKQDFRRLLEALSRRTGFKLSIDSVIQDIPEPPAQSNIAGNANTVSTLPATSEPQKEEPYGTTNIAVGDLSIPTRTYTDKSGTWYTVKDLLFDSGLKTSFGVEKILRKVDQKDYRTILQSAGSGRRLMGHVNDHGLRILLEELNPSKTEKVPALSNGISLRTNPEPDLRFGTQTFNVAGTLVRTETYTDQTGVWTSFRKLLRASKYSRCHYSLKKIEDIVGQGNMRRLPQITDGQGCREINHLNRRGLVNLLKDIEGTLVDENGLPISIPQEWEASTQEIFTTSFENSALSSSQLSENAPLHDSMEKEPIVTMVGKAIGRCGTANVAFGSDTVTLPTYAEKDGLWFCTYDLLKESGFMTSEARANFLRDASGAENIRTIRRPLGNLNNGFSHVNREGLKKLLGRLFGARKNENMHLGDLLRNTPNEPKSLLTPVSRLLDSKAPRPGDNTGVFTTLRVVIDNKTLMVKSYADNHKTWYATPDMFELVEIYDEEQQKDFLKRTLRKSDIKYVWQQYKDGLKLQAHVHKGALATLVPALNQVAEKVRQFDKSSASQHAVKLNLPGATSPADVHHKAGWIPSRATETVMQTGTSAPVGLNEVRYDAEKMEVNGKIVSVKTIYDSNGVWYSSYGILSAAGIRDDQQKLEIIKKVVSPDHIRPDELAASAAQIHIDRQGLLDLLETVNKIIALKGNSKYTSAILSAVLSGASAGNIGQGEGDIFLDNTRGILGVEVVDILGKPVTVKTSDLGNSTWYSALDIVDGFNAFETAEGKPTTKRSDISHLVRDNVEEGNARKLYQKASNQPGTRLVTHVNAKGLRQLETALAEIRRGALPPKLFLKKTTAPTVQTPAVPEAATVNIAKSNKATAEPLGATFHSSSMPQAVFGSTGVPGTAKKSSPLSYGKEVVHLLDKQFEVRNVSNENGKWYAIVDVLENTGIQEGSPQHEFIIRNIQTGEFQMFWQSGPAGIQKTNHVTSNGLFEILNAIEMLSQQEEVVAQQQERVRQVEQVEQSETQRKMRHSITKSTTTTPIEQRDAAWLKAEETRIGIVSLLHNGKKVRFVKDSAGKVYVNNIDIMPYLHRGRLKTDATYFDPDGFVKVWTPSLKSTVGAVYVGMENLEKAISRAKNPEAKTFYEWCVTSAQPRILASKIMPPGL